MPAASVAFMAPPRKVSFEDGHHETSSSPNTSSSALSVLQKELTTAPLMSRKPSLIRPITSLSLVELAQSDRSDDCSTPISSLADLAVESSESPLTPPSPWGHFVELLVPSHDVVSINSTNNNLHHYHQETCNCCSTCRRRRSSPYGDYKQQRRPLAFSQDVEQPPFRLTPRVAQDKHTEQMISGLFRLRVDC